MDKDTQSAISYYESGVSLILKPLGASMKGEICRLIPYMNTEIKILKTAI